MLSQLIIGSHVSIRKGYLAAAQSAKRIGATAFQYFPKNPRSLEIKSLAKEDTKRCSNYCKDNGIFSVAHAPYPTRLIINSSQYEQVKKSILNDLEITEACGSVGVIVHFGKISRGEDPIQAYKGIIYLLNDLLSDWSGNSKVLIENNAGTIGTTMEELSQIRSLCTYSDKIGFCLDTCHLYASGVWTNGNWDEIVKIGEGIDFFEHVKVVHLNNSVYHSGSERDRHAQIPFGKIKIEMIKKLLTYLNQRDIAFILETPNSDQLSHEEEIDFVRRL